MHAPLTVKQLIKGKLCFPALPVPIQRSSYVQCQCQKAILITEMRDEGALCLQVSSY